MVRLKFESHRETAIISHYRTVRDCIQTVSPWRLRNQGHGPALYSTVGVRSFVLYVNWDERHVPARSGSAFSDSHAEIHDMATALKQHSRVGAQSVCEVKNDGLCCSTFSRYQADFQENDMLRHSTVVVVVLYVWNSATRRGFGVRSAHNRIPELYMWMSLKSVLRICCVKTKHQRVKGCTYNRDWPACDPPNHDPLLLCVVWACGANADCCSCWGCCSRCRGAQSCLQLVWVQLFAIQHLYNKDTW